MSPPVVAARSGLGTRWVIVSMARVWDRVTRMSARYHSAQVHRPLARSDVLVNWTAAAAIVVGAGLAIYTLAFSTFEVLIPAYVPSDSEIVICPSPWSMLFGDPTFEGLMGESPVSGGVSPEVCAKRSRTLAIEAALVAVFAPLPVAWLLRRRTMPAPLPPLPLGIGSAS